MKELQAKAKVTQTMTRDGLVVENQADGTVENVSSREAEQDYSTDAEGKAEKILERAEDIKDGHKNKKKAKKASRNSGHRRKRRWPAPFRCPSGTDRGRTGRPGVAAVYPQRREQKPTSWMRPAPLCRKSVSRSRKKSTMLPAARQNPPCALSSRTKARPA